MTRKCALSPARRALIDLMFKTYYGSIENLTVRDGQPVLKPAPRVIREVKLGASKAKRPVNTHDDFALKAEFIDLFEQMDAIQNGTIECIEVQAGLPFRIRLPEAA